MAIRNLIKGKRKLKLTLRVSIATKFGLEHQKCVSSCGYHGNAITNYNKLSFIITHNNSNQTNFT